MTDPVSEKIETLSSHLEGLATAARQLDDDPSAGDSVRRIARSLESAADSLGLPEVTAGAVAIQRAADAHLGRSVTNFLQRIDELRQGALTQQATILIVEDNRTVAAATRAYLSAEDRELIVAETAEAAAQILDTRHVDLVILDLILPDRDGRDFLVDMREHAATATVPVIVLSSRAGAVARAECMAVGADEFLEKPAEPKHLRAAVSRQIKSGRQRREALLDGLTGLPNRAGILAEFEEQRRIMARTSTPLAVGVVAVDALAPVTMKLGRETGERLLLEVAAALHEAMGKEGRLGRWETAEFVALLPDRSATDARELLAATLDALRGDDAFDDIRGADIEISLSGGVARVQEGQALHEVLDSAQRSLYDARRSARGGVPSETDALGLETQRILVVEDDRVTATLLHHRLVRDGYEVIGFANGEDAYGWASEEAFDLGILDVKVPGMDGFELLSRLRDIPRHAEVPIMMLTGLGSDADVIRGLELGADDYMLKPFSPTELLARVRRLLHAHASGHTHAPGVTATAGGSPIGGTADPRTMTPPRPEPPERGDRPDLTDPRPDLADPPTRAQG